jgi:RNA polymerase sigma factor (sigma-70 family)
VPGRGLVTAHERAEAVLQDALTTSARDLLRYLEYRIGSDDAPDALSDVLLTAWRRAEDLPDDGPEARLWLFGIARNTVLNARRTSRRRSNLTEHLRRHTTETDAESADAGIEVRDAINRLEPELAELIRTVHWDGFTVAEAARLLDLPPSTATSRYQRAREKLRRSLAADDGPIEREDSDGRHTGAVRPAAASTPRIHAVRGGHKTAPAG